METKLYTIILAAGEGKRMQSDIPKVFHPIGGLPMIEYVLRRAIDLHSDKVMIVVGTGKEIIMGYVSKRYEDAIFIHQNKQLGTADAVKSAAQELSELEGDALILNGDVPLIRHALIKEFYARYKKSGASLGFITSKLDEPEGYGRVVKRAGKYEIVEENDADDKVKKIKEINAGIYLVSSKLLFKALERVKPSDTTGEYYLTDIITIVQSMKKKVINFHTDDADQVLGVNDRKALAHSESILNQRKLNSLMASGVTIFDPNTTYIEQDVMIGKDSIVYPNNFIMNGTKIGKRCTIWNGAVISNSIINDESEVKPYSIIDQSIVGRNSIIGPFARLRPDTVLDEQVHVGNFVEIKKSVLGKKTKANHLSYIGDATIGNNVNIGAGTITCNYDGVKKNLTVIEDEAFIGSDTALVAPVRIGKGALIGAGSVITKSVPADALGIERTEQKNIEGYARKRKTKLGQK
ncbi:MAG: bifunctional UDP-N-acetylglucosamine diphosphorylase/glucosamine-1-phosphate N-acetyltransferase GlmU [Deltaproteobacteria bacterium]|nr:bifunctional UDP-N-acetylglucosamine diphosphorylase/glucosamine-1-phosphate N-acetyltransferase GlmU [Deltaproteobacteria bacterium]MCL5791515.1 bifunctional UDP-N-acetylglucosamine diphosphorylase/glucosamine-1-phosphate N-acetyltransferase GlmU [Deltaproteobacteria bacterium]